MSKPTQFENVNIVIDPGHGGPTETTWGCVANGVVEKDVDLITAKALAEELSQYGNVSVYMTRTEDVEVGIKERIEYAKSVDADYFISVHYNASENHNLYGSEIYTSAFGEYYSQGYSLAQCIMNKWNEFGAIDEKGIKTRIGKEGTDYYGLIRFGVEEDIPAIILEHGYLDNEPDWSHLDNAESWENMGRLDAAGIAEYFGLQKNVVQESVSPTFTVKDATETVMPDITGPESVELVIDSYDSVTGLVNYTIAASDAGSRVMYYGIMAREVDGDTVCAPLTLWPKDQATVSGTYSVRPGYSGPITARVYNIYDVPTDAVSELTATVSETSQNASLQESADAQKDGVGNVIIVTPDSGTATSQKKGGSDDTARILIGIVLFITVFLLVLLIVATVFYRKGKRRKVKKIQRYEEEDNNEFELW